MSDNREADLHDQLHSDDDDDEGVDHCVFPDLFEHPDAATLFQNIRILFSSVNDCGMIGFGLPPKQKWYRITWIADGDLPIMQLSAASASDEGVPVSLELAENDELAEKDDSQPEHAEKPHEPSDNLEAENVNYNTPKEITVEMLQAAIASVTTDVKGDTVPNAAVANTPKPPYYPFGHCAIHGTVAYMDESRGMTRHFLEQLLSTLKRISDYLATAKTLQVGKHNEERRIQYVRHAKDDVDVIIWRLTIRMQEWEELTEAIITTLRRHDPDFVTANKCDKSQRSKDHNKKDE